MCERGQRGVTAPSANGAAAPRCLPAPRRVVSLRSITCVPHSSLRAHGVLGAEPAPMAPRQLRAHVPAHTASLPSSVPRGQAGRASSRRGLLIRAGVCQRSAPLPVLVLVLAQRHRSCCAPRQGWRQQPVPLAVPPRLGQSSTATSPGGAGRFRQQDIIPQPHGLAGCGHALQRGCPKPPSMPPRPPQPQAAGGKDGAPASPGVATSHPGDWQGQEPSRRSKEPASPSRWGLELPRGAVGAESPP